MTPPIIIREARADGVRLALSSSGTIKATGDPSAVKRWLPILKAYKPGILSVLKNAANDTPGDTPIPDDASAATVAQVATVAIATSVEEQLILAWLKTIDATGNWTDPVAVAELLERAHQEPPVREYFLSRAREG